jgi:EmrB/QacA subfamily drug resistance transporter
VPEVQPPSEVPVGQTAVDAAVPTSTAIPARQWWALAITLAGTFMAIMDTYIVNVAIPSIRVDLHASYAQVELSASAYVLAYGLVLVTGGRLGDAFGYKRMFMIGIVAFSVASLACGLAPNPVLLIVFRIVQGCAAAMFFPQVLSFIQTAFSGSALMRAFSLFTATIGLAAIAGQLIGGALISANLLGLQWRPIFLINLVIGVAVTIGAAATLPGARTPARPRLDLVGVALLAIALVLVLIPLVEGQSDGWPVWIWIMLALSVPVLTAFLRWERRNTARGAQSLVNPKLFGNRSFTVGNGVNFAFFAGSTGLYFVLTVHLQNTLGYSPLAAGLTFTTLAVTFGITSLLVPWASRLLGRHMLTIGYTINAVGALALVLIAVFAGSHLSTVDLMPALALIGIGQGLGVTPLLGAILGGVRPEDAGAASGVLETVGQVGMSLGISVLGLIYSAARGATGTDVTGAFAWALVANVVLAVVATLLVARLTRVGDRT